MSKGAFEYKETQLREIVDDINYELEGEIDPNNGMQIENLSSLFSKGRDLLDEMYLEEVDG